MEGRATDAGGNRAFILLVHSRDEGWRGEQIRSPASAVSPLHPVLLVTLPASPPPSLLQRNFVYIMLSCHWFACLMYFSARVDHFSRNSWVGRNYYRFEGQPVGVW